MSTLGTNVLTYADILKTLDPNGAPAKIIGMLDQRNDIVDDVPMFEGNDVAGHRTTYDSALPASYWRILGVGTAPSKGATQQVTEGCGALMNVIRMDQETARIGGNVEATRLTAVRRAVESMRQEIAQTIFYGNAATAPEEFNGLSPRYSSLSAGNAQNIIDGGGTSNVNASIWLIVWGEDFSGFFPKGSTAGLEHQDMGLGVIPDSTGVAGAVLLGYTNQLAWRLGLHVGDWRQAVRICNIDKTALTTESGATNITKALSKATYRVNNLSAGRAVIYMNRTCLEMFDIQRQATVNAGGGITFENVDGRMVPHFRQIPIHICDQLVLSESRVV